MKKVMIILLTSLASLNFIYSANAQEIRTISTNTIISQDTIWDGTIIIDGAKITIEQNATLSLKPGTIISSKNGALIYVIGKLKALGERNKKIRITSEYNEKSNFSLTYYIDSTSESEINMENFILERGGGNKDTASLPALTIRGKANLSKGMVRRNYITAIRTWGKDIKIDDCEIYENENVALENKSTTNTLEAENNWWGSEDGPTTTTISNSPRALIKGATDYDPWQRKGPIPIVILPGFGGSFSFKLLSEGVKDDWWLTPLGTSAYRYFAKALVLSNYFHEKDFFWGFYDWRIEAPESAKKYLEKVIDEAREKSGHSQVHVVAHSMGGLVARSYIQGSGFRDDIDSFIAAGTPHLGSSDTYPIWAGGKLFNDKKPIYLYLWYLEALDWDWNKIQFIRKNFPSIGEMLPIYSYLESSFDGSLIDYKSQKERNVFLENLSESENVEKLKRKVTTSLIVGNGEETLEKIKVAPYEGNELMWADGIPDPIEPSKDTENGDGTVIVRSANADNKITRNIFLVDSNHSRLLESGTKPILEQLKVKAKFPLLFKIMSRFLLTAKGPVDISIENSQGKFVSASRLEIEDSQYREEKIEGQKLVFSDFPVDLESREEELIKINFTGLEKGDFCAAFWNVSSEDIFSKEEIKSPIDKGVKIAYEIKFSEENNDKSIISIRNKTYTNLLQIKFPESSKKYLNWQKIDPQVDLWRNANDISDARITHELDGESLENHIDLGELSLGSHNLKAKTAYKIGGLEQSEDKEINFLVGTSLKSLITLANRFYKENKIISWDARSQLINLFAEAYQNSSNGRLLAAKIKIQEAKDLLKTYDESVFSDNKTKNKLIESLDYLENNPG